jgi:hypothetical protein
MCRGTKTRWRCKCYSANCPQKVYVQNDTRLGHVLEEVDYGAYFFCNAYMLSDRFLPAYQGVPPCPAGITYDYETRYKLAFCSACVAAGCPPVDPSIRWEDSSAGQTREEKRGLRDLFGGRPHLTNTFIPFGLGGPRSSTPTPDLRSPPRLPPRATGSDWSIDGTNPEWPPQDLIPESTSLSASFGWSTGGPSTDFNHPRTPPPPPVPKPAETEEGSKKPKSKKKHKHKKPESSESPGPSHRKPERNQRGGESRNDKWI